MSRLRFVAALLAAIAVTVAAAALMVHRPVVAADRKVGGAPTRPASAASQPAGGERTKSPPGQSGSSPNPIELGRRLATIAGCNDCHTPGGLSGAADFSRTLAGSDVGLQGPWGTSYGRNLTPDLETGLGYYG